MKLTDLLPGQFENLTFDLLQAAGLRSLVWRTPGADGGRDIEGVLSAVDFSGHYQNQKWYVECKLYSSSLDWPTVWKKIAYAESRGADFLLIVTNSNPSPACETEISNWNLNKNRLVVRSWRGYELLHILSSYPAVAAKYGLLEKLTEAEISLQPLMAEVMKAAQAAHVAHQFGRSFSMPLEASAAVAELISMRQDQLHVYGKIVASRSASEPPDFEWLEWTGAANGWEDVGLRSLLTMMRYTSGSKNIVARAESGHLHMDMIHPRFALTPSTRKTLVEIALWANIEIVELSDESAVLQNRS
ncbi:hypothetical protein X727_27000 [Mesorhizobium sp. L103C119B0]|uniref:restriction endonuclease n=1 Tax=Mesorhizobium sp. L103C119B0 TaxID=1287085 RepID=UPI0003D06284|nr:restriction endonuclease [Mesorhizobium sp. L103C119B0]ESZ66685.1 hypothetical protein X727_27000 [Mesorhizobium sp. L103C119B0]